MKKHYAIIIPEYNLSDKLQLLCHLYSVMIAFVDDITIPDF